MSLDVSKLKEKLEQLKNPKKFANGDKNTWKPTEGETKTVRIVEYPHGDSGDPIVTLWMHYNIGQERGLVCPKRSYNKACPICNFAFSLYKTDFNLFKDVAAKQQFFAVVVDRADEKPAPRFWRFSKKIYEKLLMHLIDPEYQHALDPVTGIDLDVSSAKGEKQQYATTDIKFKRKESKLAATDKEIKELLKSIKKIEDVFTCCSEEELSEKLAKWLKGDKPEKDSEETVRGGAKADAKTGDVDVSEEEDIDKIFDEAYEGNSN